MTPEDALAYLVADDVARREAEAYEHGQHLRGAANLQKLRAWRRAHGICRCGAVLPRSEVFSNCERCRERLRVNQRSIYRNMTGEQRLEKNRRARKSYHKLAHGKAAPPKVVTEVVTPRNQPSTAKRNRASYMRAYRAQKKGAAL